MQTGAQRRNRPHCNIQRLECDCLPQPRSNQPGEQAVDNVLHRWMRCPSTVENLGFSTGRPSGLSSIQRCMEDFFRGQLGHGLSLPAGLRGGGDVEQGVVAHQHKFVGAAAEPGLDPAEKLRSRLAPADGRRGKHLLRGGEGM